jgi:hypothetical protein
MPKLMSAPKKNKKLIKTDDSSSAVPNLFAPPTGIVVKHKKTKREKIIESLPEAVILDVTSQAKDEFGRLSPFFPHGDIPVPEWPEKKSCSVEGLWQGLKVFEGYEHNPKNGPDFSKLHITNMRGLKRSVRTHGRVIGHLCADGTILDYLSARRRIYLPAYRYVLENCVAEQVEKIRLWARQKTVVLLDYNLNADVNDVEKPLSHAALVRLWIEGKWPVC